MRAIVENLHDGLVITDLQDTITYANGRISEMCGYSNAELVGQNAHQLLSTPELWPVCDQRNCERAAGASGTYEMPLLHKNGSTVWALINGSPLRDDSGAIVGTIGAHFDITERKHAEAERAHFARQLEQPNRDLEAFAYAVSHDLKEPLRKIEAFGARLRARLLGEPAPGEAASAEAVRFLDGMTRSAERMQHLIDDLLEYSRLQGQAPRLESVDLGEVWRDLVEDFEGAMNGARVEIGALPRVTGDRARLRQLFANLLSNALKFRGAAAPLVRVRWLNPNDPGDSVEIEVSDNGIGFEMEQAEAIFEVFRRLHGHAQYPGTGIGLALCRRIAREHGGDVRAASRPGKGAQFVVRLQKQPDAP